MTATLECVHRPPCPGCPHLGQTGLSANTEAAVAELSALLGVPTPVVRTGDPSGYRKRSRLAVRGSSRNPQLGLFELGTHRVAATDTCLVHDPLINRVAQELSAAIRKTRTPLYVEEHHVGLLRYVQVVVERSTQRAQVCLVMNSADPECAPPLLEELQRRLGQTLQGLHLNFNTARGNTILGKEFHRVCGAEATVEQLGGAAVYFPPGAFGQANLDLFEVIVERMHGLVPAGASVVELYCGVGAIGLGLLRRGHAVVFNEISPAGLAGLRLGLSAQSSARPEMLRSARLEPGAAEQACSKLSMTDAVVIVDPPRKGLAPDLLETLVAQRPARLLYLSCGLPSLLRDARVLKDAGFVCESLDTFALFPFTDHVETLACFASS